ncbi:hypothetical protein BDA99DRAFT_258635 [Phascolomyces articulosus]|uniref:Transcription factor TFIIIC triple barrel domain-containing protein n=1 Tax=Phascolomyces articulosus TaxID=60185 RepID=A0AAD5JP43_9FUNG|nr:hypothetical protein BDA99DRAFT_258635 [Phascolomyces articulosus]
MSDSDDEYEEETVHLVVDLGPEMDPGVLERLARENTPMSYLGTEEGEQFFQLNGTTFRGQLDETISTNLLFEVHERKREGPGLIPLLTSIKREGEDESTQALRQQQQQQVQHSELSFAVKTDNVVMCDRVTLLQKESIERNVPQPMDTATPGSSPSTSSSHQRSQTPPSNTQENYSLLLAQHNKTNK